MDRKALPAPAGNDISIAARNVILPCNDTEEKLLEIWRHVLGISDIGIEDDIFDLGGDSILIFQITTRANKAGVAITPAHVFRLRTVAALASEYATSGTTMPPTAIQRVDRNAYRRKL